jgi:hypothetical protein
VPPFFAMVLPDRPDIRFVRMGGKTSGPMEFIEEASESR